MNVSIVVTHYKSPQVLKLSLGYLYNWKKEFEKDKNNKAEIIVSDSDTQNEVKVLLLDRYPGVRLITSNSNLGFGKAANRGIVQAKGEYIVVMNSDVIIPEPQNITVMLEYLERNPDVGLVGPKLLNFDNSHQPSAFRYYTPLSIVLRRTPLGKTSWGKEKIDKFMMRDYENLTETPTEVDWLMGSIMATKKSYIEKIGLFDERFFMYMEDVDLCRRYWENDLKVIYYPLAAVYHFHGRASRTKNIFFALLNKYTRTHLMSAIKYFKKHGLKTPRYGK